MFDKLYEGLTVISKDNGNCKIVFGKLVVKRFAYIWHVGDESFTGFLDASNYKDHLITVSNCEYSDKVIKEVCELVKELEA